MNTEEWHAELAPSCPADIWIKIRDEANEVMFHLRLGEFLAHELEDYVRLDGVLLMSAADRLILLRIAAHLERHARMIRDTLAGPITDPNE